MIKATISNKTKETSFTKAKKIAHGTYAVKPNIRGLVLDNYKHLGSGNYFVLENNKDNVILFTEQKEVA